MAAKYFPYFLVILFIKEANTVKLHFIMPDENKDFNLHSHYKIETVKTYCFHRNDACKSNNTNVCGVKRVNKKLFYKDFVNGCYLFLSNMCDHPAEEYFIVSGGTCEQYLTVRRSNEDEADLNALPNHDAGDEANSTENNSNDNDTVTDSVVLRKAKHSTKISTLYDIDTSFDYHLCPHSCPRTYSPVCVNINRGFGKYFKMLTFVNHCSADLYYCKNWNEFQPPPNEDEAVRASPLAWSFCGASRYLQFARFAEAASSMGHYGWLAGDYKYSHIMEPHQRIPGYGKRHE